MRKGIIILCRYSSNRLPGKILKPIRGKAVLQYIYERVSLSKGADKIVIATSSDKTDDPIAEYCSSQGIPYYRGSLMNVSERFAKCALDNELDLVTRINGDNIFADFGLIDQSFQICEAGGFDFVSNVRGRTFPIGMSVETLHVGFYANILSQLQTKEYQEHVTLYLYDHLDCGKFKFLFNDSFPSAKGLKFAIDTKEDFQRGKEILAKMSRPHTTYTWIDIVKLVDHG